MNKKESTIQGLVLLLIITLSFFAGGLVYGAIIKDKLNCEETVNIIKSTEVYSEDGTTLTIITEYHEDGSIDTYTEFTYPSDNIDEGYEDNNELNTI